MLQTISKFFTFIFNSNLRVVFLLLSVFLITEIIINPIGNFPLNDDWWYAKTLLNNSNLFEAKNWGYTSMIAQLIYGKLFISLFGSSYTTLRLSTLLLSFFGLVFFYLLLEKLIIKQKTNAFIITLLIFYNPLFLSLSNSFMTDIPFLSFSIIGLYFYFKHSSDKKLFHLLVSALFLILAVLTRQLALSFIIGVFISTIFIQRKFTVASIFLFLTPLFSLFAFEYFLRSKIGPSFYSSAFFRDENWGNVNTFLPICANFSKRWIHYISFTGFVLCPILIPYLYHYFRNKIYTDNKTNLIISSLLFLPVVWSLQKFPIGNYLYNTGVGPETLFDTYIAHTNLNHSSSPLIFNCIKFVSFLGSFGLLLILVNSLRKLWLSIKKPAEINKLDLTIYVSMFFYYSFLSIQGAIFDRYIMVFSIMIIPILIRETNFIQPLSSNLFLAFSVLLIVFSILTTKDYLNTNRTRWAAVDLLKNKYNISDKNINAGYEHEGHCFPDSTFTFDKWRNIPESEYLISYGPVKNYYTYKWLTYRRYIPFKRDTVFILKRAD